MLNLYQYHNQSKKLDMFNIYKGPIAAFMHGEFYVRGGMDAHAHWRKDLLVDKPKFDPILHILKRSPEYAYLYARDIIKSIWIDGEEAITKSSYYSYLYAREIIKGRWIEAEPVIMKNPSSAYYYARNVIKGRWEEAEANIL